jgi:hypothetical protein
MIKTSKQRHMMTLNEMFASSGWFPGTPSDWEALQLAEREELSFAATGCVVAWPSWEMPVDCYHLRCRIRRGELPRIAETNSILRAEHQNGWLRFIEDRSKVARIFRTYRRHARATGIYDPWKLGGMGLVFAGIELSTR